MLAQTKARLRPVSSPAANCGRGHPTGLTAQISSFRRRDQGLHGGRRADQAHHKGNRLLAELNSSHLNRDFIVLISIARGIGKGPILGGMSWGFGDDWIWQFRKVDDRIHVVRRNVRFTATKGEPRGKGRQSRLYR